MRSLDDRRAIGAVSCRTRTSELEIVSGVYTFSSPLGFLHFIT